ncbi:MAG: thiamine ABC transporter substrate-binding protein, partial [Spirochaetota bacterium]
EIFITRGTMMKTKLLCLLISAAFAVLSLINCKKESRSAIGQELTIYAYDSFVSEWGPGVKVIPKFEKQLDIKVTIQSAGDANQVLSKAILEKDSPAADIIIGIDNNMLAKALRSGILDSYKSPNVRNIPQNLIFDKTYHVTPFDYGYFSIIYDTQKISEPPRSLEDLTKPEYRKSLILMDPRTSSPGLGFLLWTIAIYGDNFVDYWKRLNPSILTITEGWDTGYGLFTSGEAPLVLSYTTSPAYHVEYEKTTRYQAVVFTEGNYMQIEGMGILKKCKNRKAAEKFIDFMLTEDFQSEIPLTNWMFPVNPSIKLPESFSYAPKTGKALLLDSEKIKTGYDTWIQQWVETVSR